MKNVVVRRELTKRGFKTVVYEQGIYSDGQKWYVKTENGIEQNMVTADNMNLDYQRHLRAGWKVKEPEEAKEAKVAAPPKPRIKWCKEGRRIWAAENSRKIRELKEADDGAYYKLPGKERQNRLNQILAEAKEYMKVWEIENADAINATLA